MTRIREEEDGRNPDSKYKYYLSLAELEKVDEIKELGILFDSELSFVSHCKERISKTCSILGIINRVITFLKNLEMSGNLTAVREMSGILLKVREMSRN